MVPLGRLKPLYKKAGYEDSDFDDLDIALPETWNEAIDSKPSVQKSWRDLCQKVGEIKEDQKERALNYVRFYAHLT
jgi:hypothetical protein